MILSITVANTIVKIQNLLYSSGGRGSLALAKDWARNIPDRMGMVRQGVNTKQLQRC